MENLPLDVARIASEAVGKDKFASIPVLQFACGKEIIFCRINKKLSAEFEQTGSEGGSGVFFEYGLLSLADNFAVVDPFADPEKCDAG